MKTQKKKYFIVRGPLEKPRYFDYNPVSKAQAMKTIEKWDKGGDEYHVVAIVPVVSYLTQPHKKVVL